MDRSRILRCLPFPKVNTHRLLSEQTIKVPRTLWDTAGDATELMLYRSALSALYFRRLHECSSPKHGVTPKQELTQSNSSSNSSLLIRIASTG